MHGCPAGTFGKDWTNRNTKLTGVKLTKVYRIGKRKDYSCSYFLNNSHSKQYSTTSFRLDESTAFALLIAHNWHRVKCLQVYGHLMLYNKTQAGENKHLGGITQFTKLTWVKHTLIQYNGLLVRFFTVDNVISMFQHVGTLNIAKLANKCTCISLFSIRFDIWNYCSHIQFVFKYSYIHTPLILACSCQAIHQHWSELFQPLCHLLVKKRMLRDFQHHGTNIT